MNQVLLIRLYYPGFLVVLTMNLLVAVQFMADPLGMSPVLDARENFAWAERIANDTLASEPMYRALLYPAVLALFAKLGLLSTITVTGFGLLCHGFNAYLVGRISKSLWSSDKAAWLAGLLYGAYPVATWFAVQALDITLGISFFLWAVATLLKEPKEPEIQVSWARLIAVGILAGLAVATRPNFLPAVLCLPFLAMILNGGLAAWRHVMPVGVGLAFILLAQGGVNLALSGEFRILPWQGAYNLYAANRDGANGKYLAQQVAFDAIPEGMNPTRMESEYLYRRATGIEGPLEIGEMNQYWKGRLKSEVIDEPFRWLGLMFRKSVFLLNDWEQYNNLTYAYHKERLQPLKWNPLGWGVLLLGALLAVCLGWKRLSAPKGIALALIFLSYAAGVLLFFVSARFRLPLAPLLSVFCGGLLTISWRSLAWPRWLTCAGLCCVGAVFVYGDWFDAQNKKTFKQDRLLLAKASFESGQSLMAADLSAEVLNEDPQHLAARQIRVGALFALWADDPDLPSAEVWTELGTALERLEHDDAGTGFIRGVYLWRQGGRDRAIQVWSDVVHKFGKAAAPSAAALSWVRSPDRPGLSELSQRIGRLLSRP